MHCASHRESETEAAFGEIMNRVFVIAVSAGIALGVWHLKLAIEAIFVFRAGEPIISWIAILSGPASTLPAALAALFTKRGGGYWLVGGGFFSFLIFALGERGVTENFFPYLSMISLPMIVLGAVLLYLPKKRSLSPG